MPLSKRILPHGKKTITALAGVNKLIAGDNITLSPTVGTGSVTITAGAGGGGGTVDPSLQYQVPYFRSTSALSGTAAMAYDAGSEKLELTSTVVGNASLQLQNTQATSTASGLEIYNQSSQVFQIGHNNNTAENYLWGTGDIPLKFATSGTERMRILAGGNVGIGTTSPGARLQVGDSTATGDYILVERDSSDTTYDVLYGKAKYPRISLNDQGSYTMSIWVLGSTMRFGSAGGSTTTSAFYVTNGSPLSGEQYGAAVVPGHLMVGDSNSVINNGRLTITETTTPQLVLANDGSNYFSLTADGDYLRFKANAGNTATMALRDNGNTYFNGQNVIFETSQQNYFQIKGTNTLGFGSGADFSMSASGTKFYMTSGTSVPSATPILGILQNGNVGIGTDTPAEKLTIGGTGKVLLDYNNTGPKSSTEMFHIVTSGTEAAFAIEAQSAGSGIKNMALLPNLSQDIKNLGQYWDSGGGFYTDIYEWGWDGDATPANRKFQFKMTDDYPIHFIQDNNDRLVIASGGKVGIGTASPVYDLDIHSTYPRIGLTDTNGITFYIQNQSNHIYFYDVTNGATRLFIEDGGNVGIGSTAPVAKLEVSGAIALSSGSVTSAPGYTSLWASGSGLYWGDQEVYTNAPGTSEITGGGASTQLTYFDGSSTITGSSNLTFDGTRFSSHVRIANDKKLLLGNSAELQMYHSSGASSYLTNSDNGFYIWNMDSAGGTLQLRNDREDYGIQMSISGTEAARFTRVSGKGRLGIGTTNPGYPLDVYTSNSGSVARFKNASSNGYVLRLEASDSTLDFQTDHIIPTYNMHLGNDNVNWYIRTAGYKFGVGTSSPKTSMSLVGALSIQERADHETTNADWGQLWVKNDSPNKLYFTDDAGTDFDLTAGGGSSVSFGSDNQIPYTNAGGTDFDYSANLTFNGTIMYVSEQLKLPGDNYKLMMGASDDLQLYHEGTDSYITSAAGDIYLKNTANNEDIYLNVNDGGVDTIGLHIRGQSGRVGIGNFVGPSAQLQVQSTTEQLRLSYDGSYYNTFTTTGDGSLEINRNGTASTDRIALLSGSNILLGRYAGHDLNSSQTGESVIIGNFAGWELKGNETHGRHTIIGASAAYTMSGTTDSDYITAIGAYCASYAQTNRGFTAVGAFAGYYLTGSGDGPLLLGAGVGKGTAFAAWGTSNGVTMSEDVLIGNGGVCEYSETLSENTIVGSRAAGFMRVGTQNVAVGRFAMRNASGSNGTTGNVAIGQSAGQGIGQFNDTGGSNYNIAVGYETQEKNLAGDRNIAIGYKVGIDGASTADDILRIGNASGDYSFIRGDMANNNLWIGAGTPKFTITGSNVGIGTTAPDDLLHVLGGNVDPSIKLQNNRSGDNGYYLMEHRGSTLKLQSTGSSVVPMRFTIQNTDMMRLDATGLGIGTDSPAQLLDVSGGSIRGYDGTREVMIKPTNGVAGDNTYTSIFGSEGLMLGTTGDSYVDVWNTGARYTRFRHATGSTTDGAMTYMSGSVGSSEFFRIKPTGTNYQKDAYLYATRHVTLASAENLQLDANASMTFSYDGEFNIYNDQGTAAPITIRSGSHASMEFEADGDIQFKDNTTKLMKLTSGGRLGIGTTSPSTKLEVLSSDGFAGYFRGTSTATIASDTTNNHYLRIKNASTTDATTALLGFQLAGGYQGAFVGIEQWVNGGGADAYGNLVFGTKAIGSSAPVRRMTILHDGKVGIGTAEPPNALSVWKAINNDFVAELKNTHATAGQSWGLQVCAGTNASDAALVVENEAENASLFYVRGDGNVGIGTTSPSVKLHVVGDALIDGYLHVDKDASPGLLVGEGGDADIYYDGTNMRFNAARVGAGKEIHTTNVHASGASFQKSLGEVVYLRNILNTFDVNAILQHAPNIQYVKPEPTSAPGVSVIPTELPLADADNVGLEITVVQDWSANPTAALSVQKQTGSSDVIYEGGSNSASSTVSIAAYRGANKTFMIAAVGVWVVKD